VADETIPRRPLPRLVVVDALRGVAALLVLVFHGPHLTGPLVVLKPIGAMGWSGVGLFLVISGFSIHFRWAASDVPHHDFAVGRFARRRFFRLYPTYVAAVILAIIVTLIVGGTGGFGAPWIFTAGNQPVLVSLLSQIVMVFANVAPVPYLAVTWSLGLEVQLYAMYAVLIRRLRAIGVLRVVIISLAVTIAWGLASELLTTSMPVGQFFPDGHASGLSRLLYSELPARCFEWLLGVLAAEACFGRVTLPKVTRSPIAAAGLLLIAAILFRHPLGASSLNGHPFMLSDVILNQLLGVAYFVVLLAAIRRDEPVAEHRVGGPILRSLASVGLFSYSLYLTHESTLRLGTFMLRGSGVPQAVATVILWTFAVAAAWLFFSLIERHFIAGNVDRWVVARWAARRGIAIESA
jgi:peptidoglycan/LPS O-acetylase OafA/YrhL